MCFRIGETDPPLAQASANQVDRIPPMNSAILEKRQHLVGIAFAPPARITRDNRRGEFSRKRGHQFSASLECPTRVMVRRLSSRARSTR